MQVRRPTVDAGAFLVFDNENEPPGKRLADRVLPRRAL